MTICVFLFAACFVLAGCSCWLRCVTCAAFANCPVTHSTGDTLKLKRTGAYWDRCGCCHIDLLVSRTMEHVPVCAWYRRAAGSLTDSGLVLGSSSKSAIRYGCSCGTSCASHGASRLRWPLRPPTNVPKRGLGLSEPEPGASRFACHRDFAGVHKSPCATEE